MESEKTLESDEKEESRLELSLDEITDSLGQSNYLYDDPENLSDEEIEWKRRRWKLIEQEIVSKIESEDEGEITRDISHILYTAEREEANFQAVSETLMTYIVENTNGFHSRLERENIKYRLEKSRKNSGLFEERNSSIDSNSLTNVESIANATDKAVIGLGLTGSLLLFTGIAFSGAGITVVGLSLLAFVGKVSGVIAAMMAVLAAIGRLAERE